MGKVGLEKKQPLISKSCDCFTESTDSLVLPVDAILGKCSGIVVLGKILWALPWSFWGAAIGCLGLLTGGRVRRRGRIVEFWGGIIPLFLRYFPFIAGSPVSTFGHVVVGRSQRHLDACRPHQMIHVRQYECWGPLFIPLYLAWWFILLCQGKRPYYDNPFEREAYDATS